MKKALLIAATAALVSLSAHAAQIDGTVDFAGPVRTVNAANATVPVSVATGLDFNAGVSGFAVTGSGTLGALIPSFSTVLFTDFQFSPVLSPSPVSPLWVANGITFTLSSVSITSQTGTGLTLFGTGTISAPGYDLTSGTWTIGVTSPDSVTFSFQSGTAAGVPDGGTTVMLLGAALSGLGLIRRKMAA
ncbi:MAG TPA: VPDSG-CTERM sorting domain-containing protein [Verrucomicrobiae bacterium]|nr:VPDSG-CTERM sorting domain-containing protein [Verrucomicrobiae bacterium]